MGSDISLTLPKMNNFREAPIQCICQKFFRTKQTYSLHVAKCFESGSNNKKERSNLSEGVLGKSDELRIEESDELKIEECYKLKIETSDELKIEELNKLKEK